jgi:hypothetical protein
MSIYWATMWVLAASGWAAAWNWLSNNITAYYKSDSNWSYPDEVWSNDWTIDGATFDASWKINWDYNYDWTNDLITLPAAALDLSSAFTWNAWVLKNEKAWANDNDRIMTKYTDSNNFLSFSTDDNTGKLWIYLKRWGTTITNQLTYWAYWTWSYVMYTITCTSWGTMKFYIDWVDTSSDWSVWIWTWTTVWYTLWTRPDKVDPVVFLDWNIDEVWTWTEELSQTKIDALYNSWSWLSYDSFTS